MKRTLILVSLLTLAVSAFAQESKPAQQAQSTETSPRTSSGASTAALTPSQIFRRARSSVVVIVASDQNGQHEALGSGFIVSHGRIATNHHVVAGMSKAYAVFSDGDFKQISKVVADSSEQDLIILAVETGSRSPLKFGDELSLQQGDPVYALGAPKGLELSFTNGVVSSFRKSNAQFLIQATAPIAPGSSGGPLFDRTGRVVGVTTSLVSDAPGIYFSVGISDIRRLLRAPQGVALPLEQWAKQQSSDDRSTSATETPPDPSHDEPSSTPSLQDTLSWIQSFSQAHGQRIIPGQGLTHKNVLYVSKETPCAILIAHESPHAADGSEKSASEFIKLGDVNPASVKTDEDDNVVLESTDPSGKFDRVGDWGKTMGRIEELNFRDYLVFDSAESALRFATALKHAVVLCGGTKAPF